MDKAWPGLTFGCRWRAPCPVPLLLIRGRSSDLVSEETAREFVQQVPGSEYVDVADARHMVAGDSNDMFSNALIEFLDRKIPTARRHAPSLPKL